MLKQSLDHAHVQPGIVLETASDRIHLRLEDGSLVDARIALAVPICPAVGDELLVIGQHDRHFIIGVLHSSGPASIAFPHGVEVTAGDGAMKLHSSVSVDLETPALNARVGRLELVAEVMWQRLTHGFVWVRDLLQSRLGRRRTVVETMSVERAATTVITADETMKIDGGTIHLG